MGDNFSNISGNVRIATRGSKIGGEELQKSKQERLVFISYGLEDQENVFELYEWLRLKSISSWLDCQNLRGGDDWDSVIEKTIRNSASAIICFSAKTRFKQGYFKKEQELILKISDLIPERFKVFPVTLDNTEIPKEFSIFQVSNFLSMLSMTKLELALFEHLHRGGP